MKTTPPAQHPLAGSSPVHTRIRGYSSPIAAPGNQRRRAAQRAPTWDAQPAFLCFSLPGQGDWQFPALTTWRTLSFLVITKVPGLWTILWPRDQWCDTAKGSGACESRGQTRHSRYTAYPPAGPRLHVSLLAARARAAQGLPPLRLELPKVTTPRNPASRVCFVCEEGTKHEHHFLYSWIPNLDIIFKIHNKFLEFLPHFHRFFKSFFLYFTGRALCALQNMFLLCFEILTSRQDLF